MKKLKESMSWNSQSLYWNILEDLLGMKIMKGL